MTWTGLPPKHLGMLFDWHAGKRRQTEMHLDRPFDIAPDGGLVYDGAALAGLVQQASAWFSAAGVRRGDRVAVIKRNHFDMVLLAAGAARIGAVAATISSANRSVHLQEMLEKLQPRLTLTSSDVLDRARSAGVDLAHAGRLLLLDEPQDGLPQGATLLRELQGSVVPEVSLGGDDEPMMITHTSGTTSTPKLVVHTPSSARAGTRLELLPLPFAVNGSRDVALSSISFAHSRAYAWAAAQLRWAPKRLVIASSHDAADVERVLETHRPSTVEATPNVFQSWVPLLRRRPELFGHVRYYMNTFDMMHPSIARQFLQASRRTMPMWAHSWGQSEVGPIAGSAWGRRQMLSHAGTAEDNMNTLGWPWPGLIRLRVVDADTGRRVRRGERGVFMVKTPALCTDYWGDTERYRSKRAGEWWNTGDVGYQDRLGRVHFVDRAVDAIDGTSATELESVLLERLAGALEIILLARDDGDPVPVVCVDGEFSMAAWRDATRDLPALAEPVVMPWSDLPRTSTWKVRRKELRQTIFVGGDDTVLDERFI
ncbi:class I adenylate-forming enzyme family protein [Cellulomonas sp. URHD0024]|uniref:class I adenylate-forming enzyme family protein n=1 Tax=Cellulomonas sp. URHD0024 TaxID=1302620 RepID=UPI0004807291|nr:class I adenylate-forming enzyme family protein [Cellulomonas sp. URHD0024]